jgi:hypothetical protein
MKQLLFTNWHPMRWLRLAFALFLFVQAYTTHEWFFIAFVLFFVFLPKKYLKFGCQEPTFSSHHKENILLMWVSGDF